MQTFEVEIKFRVEEVAKLEQRLRQFGGTEFGEQVVESDFFFQHPCRNFVQTDECLRLRNRVLPDDTSEHSLTYKGPKIDALTKTRQEIEISVTEPERWESLLIALGFCKSATVRKFRRRQELVVNHLHIGIALDILPALPESSRTFVEIETLATEGELGECRSMLISLADQLTLGEPIRDSYLKMVTSVQ